MFSRLLPVAYVAWIALPSTGPFATAGDADARTAASESALVKGRAAIERGRPDLALQRADRALAESRDAAMRFDWTELRAQALFALGAYPECERVLRELAREATASGAEAGPDRVDAIVGRLANVLALQGLHGDALEVIESRVSATQGESTRLRRIAVSAAFRGRRFDRAREHVDALLAVDSDDPFARFSRGIVRARDGDYEAAVRDLSWGLRLPGAERDARFELGLALGKQGAPRRALDPLWAILEADPYDDEACYQLSRQYVAIGGQDAAQLAAALTRYFEMLQNLRGASSREEHLAASGRAAESAIERAARFERLGALGRALDALRRAATVGRRDPGVLLYRAEFWMRHGLLREAARTLDAAGELALRDERVRRLQAEVTRRLETDLESDASELAEARYRLAMANPGEVEAALEACLLAGDRAPVRESDRRARLLLAIAPDSIVGLSYLLRRTQDPALLPVHWHFLGRLVRVSGRERDRARRETLRQRLFLGDSPGRDAPASKDPASSDSASSGPEEPQPPER